MTMPVRLSFIGRMEDSEPNANLSYPDTNLVDQLNRSHKEIEGEIANQIAELAGMKPNTVSLKFESGSIVWTGFVEFLHHVHPYITDMADVGGAIALVQLIGTVVNSSVKKWSKTLGGVRAQNFHPSTQVFIVSAGGLGGLWRTRVIFEAAAIVFSVASVIAAIALLIIARK